MALGLRLTFGLRLNPACTSTNMNLTLILHLHFGFCREGQLFISTATPP